MAEIKVSSSELRNKANELRQLNSQFKKVVDEMVGNEQRLMGMWDGEAKESFHLAFNNDKVQMDNFYNEINRYCEALESNASKYEAQEQKNITIATNRTYK